MDKLHIIKLASDMIRNQVSGNYSVAQTSEALRRALIEANGNTSRVDIKTFRRGNALFDIVEEIIPVIIHEGLNGNEFFYHLVDYRNIALGDEIDFWTEDKAEFIVADAAYGTSGIRRQRLGVMEKYNIPSQLKIIKVYEELKRLMAGGIDFNTFISKAGNAMTRELLNDTYSVFDAVSTATRGLNATYVKSGTYNEETLLELVEHVEAATEATATIMGTKAALRKITTAVISDEAKADMYGLGYYGKFNGTNMVYLPQRHKPGTDTFLLDSNKIYVFAGSDKPIKVVNVGTGILSTSDPLQTPDMTQNYLYGQEFGVGLVFNEKAGFYTLSK